MGHSHHFRRYGDTVSDVVDCVIERIKAGDDIDSGRGLDLWREDPKVLKRRMQVLREFLEKISTDNPKPSAKPRTVIRAVHGSNRNCR